MASTRIVTSSAGIDPGRHPKRKRPAPREYMVHQDFDGYKITEQPLHHRRPIRLVCVGAGVAGLPIAYKAERLLKDVQIQIYDKNSDIGGTWLENRYPGCTCDIPSHS
jgi:NAD(P)-binding Rossmann-like domain